MRRILFTFLILSAIGFTACRKSSSDLDIKGYDNQQIQNYISANGLTSMVRDTSGGDTTGIYYQILEPGDHTKPVDYPDAVSFVYAIKTFDNKFTAADTVLNHFYGYVGHISPNGLMLGVRNILKYKGAKIRMLIPSHLAYGTNGVGSGSNTITSGRVAGNQCLDYTVFLINDQAVYDELVIQHYMTANGLTGYTKTASGLYYKVTTVGTGSAINMNSNVTANYAGKLMNNNIFDDHSVTTATFGDLANYAPGFSEGLQLAKGQGAISLIMPSKLGYGNGAATGIPANACLRFDINHISVAQN